MVYPALLSLVGAASIFVLLYFVVPRFASVFANRRCRCRAHEDHAGGQRVVQWGGGWRWALGGAAGFARQAYIRPPQQGRCGGTASGCGPGAGRRAAKGGNGAFAPAPWARWWPTACRWCRASGSRGNLINNRRSRLARCSRGAGREARRRHCGPLRKTGRVPSAGPICYPWAKRPGGSTQMFARMADIYERHPAAIKRFTSLFEPLIILVMGVMVGALILSMLLAITSINEVAV
jgi:general secretion pathway protein F